MRQYIRTYVGMYVRTYVRIYVRINTNVCLFVRRGQVFAAVEKPHNRLFSN